MAASVLAVALFTVHAPQTAFANPSPRKVDEPGAAPNRDVAREFFLTGVAAYQRGSYNAALVSFENAYRIAPHPNVRINIANCHVQLRHYLEALVHFEAYLSEAQNITPAQRADVERQVREVRAQLAEVRVRIGPATVTSPTVTIDGRAVNPNETVRLMPGRHEFSVTAEGYLPEQASLELRAGAQREWAIDLRTPSSATPASEPGAPSTPPPNPDPASSNTEPAAPTPPTTPAPTASPPRTVTPATNRWPLPVSLPTVIAGGVTTLSLACWVGLGAGALSAYGAFNDAARNIAMQRGTYAVERQRGLDAAARTRTLAIGADVSMVLTLSGAAATAVLLFVTRPSPFARPARASIHVLPAPLALEHGAGLSVGGSF